MTDEQIIKAFECCFIKEDCTECPNGRQSRKDCCEATRKGFARVLLDLINSLKKDSMKDNRIIELQDNKIAKQKAEIEKYKELNILIAGQRDERDKCIAELEAETERLKDYNENLLTANTALSNEILDIKSEARKEFAESFKDKLRKQTKWVIQTGNCRNIGFSYDDVFFGIDYLLEEMENKK